MWKKRSDSVIRFEIVKLNSESSRAIKIYFPKPIYSEGSVVNIKGTTQP